MGRVTAKSAGPMSRRHDIDTLRVIAFALLIVYHVGMVYVAGWDFHIKSPHQQAWLQWPMVAVNRWRMPLIFMLSGIALALSLPGLRSAGGLGRVALQRSGRLLLPLVFGMVAIVPVQAYCEAVINGAVEPGFGSFLWRYLQFRPWPEGGFAGAAYGITWNHLWFLPYLWAYTLLLLAVLPICRTRVGVRLAAGRLAPAGWPAAPLVLLPTAWFFASLYLLEPRFPESHAFEGDWYAHAKYLACFVLGYALGGDPRFWARIDRMRWACLAIATLSIALYMLLRSVGAGLVAIDPADIPDWDWSMVSRWAHALYLWSALLTILAFGHRLLDRPWSWLPRANEAVYPWYILHQSLIVPLAFMTIPLGLAGWLEAGVVLAGTVLGCFLIHEWLIRRTPLLRPLFGLPRAALNR